MSSYCRFAFLLFSIGDSSVPLLTTITMFRILEKVSISELLSFHYLVDLSIPLTLSEIKLAPFIPPACVYPIPLLCK